VEQGQRLNNSTGLCANGLLRTPHLVIVLIELRARNDAALAVLWLLGAPL
jgi:hypothetical protein